MDNFFFLTVFIIVHDSHKYEHMCSYLTIFPLISTQDQEFVSGNSQLPIGVSVGVDGRLYVALCGDLSKL